MQRHKMLLLWGVILVLNGCKPRDNQLAATQGSEQVGGNAAAFEPTVVEGLNSWITSSAGKLTINPLTRAKSKHEYDLVEMQMSHRVRSADTLSAQGSAYYNSYVLNADAWNHATINLRPAGKHWYAGLKVAEWSKADQENMLSVLRPLSQSDLRALEARLARETYFLVQFLRDQKNADAKKAAGSAIQSTSLQKSERERVRYLEMAYYVRLGQLAAFFSNE